MATNPGYNRYMQIMDDYAKYKPGKGESDIKYQKMAMAGNLTEKAFDADAAKTLAYTQGEVSSNLARQEADLQMRNESEARAQEFDYGMQSMGAQFDYQNEFANSQYDRDVGMLAATGEQDRKNMAQQGDQERLSTINKGAQDRLTIGAQGEQNRKQTKTEAKQERKTMGYADTLEAGKENRQQARSRSLARAF
jgi:hypothetical protein